MRRLLRRAYRACIVLFATMFLAWIVSPWIGLGFVFRGADWTGSWSVYSCDHSMRLLWTSSGTHVKRFQLLHEFWTDQSRGVWVNRYGPIPQRMGFGYLKGAANEPNYTDQTAPVHFIWIPHWLVVLVLGAVLLVVYLRRKPGGAPIEPATALTRKN